jgi:hypothetical protein
MRILSNSSVALAGVLALAPCIPAAYGQTFPAGVTPVRGAVTVSFSFVIMTRIVARASSALPGQQIRRSSA